MKTITKIWEQNFKAAYPYSSTSVPSDWVINAFQEYADQEKAALKERIKQRIKDSYALPGFAESLIDAIFRPEP